MDILISKVTNHDSFHINILLSELYLNTVLACQVISMKSLSQREEISHW